MRSKAVIVARVLLGLVFFVFGLSKASYSEFFDIKVSNLVCVWSFEDSVNRALARIFHEKCTRRAETAALAFARAALRG
jgi:hypothetical protein